MITTPCIGDSDLCVLIHQTIERLEFLKSVKDFRKSLEEYFTTSDCCNTFWEVALWVKKFADLKLPEYWKDDLKEEHPLFKLLLIFEEASEFYPDEIEKKVTAVLLTWDDDDVVTQVKDGLVLLDSLELTKLVDYLIDNLQKVTKAFSSRKLKLAKGKNAEEKAGIFVKGVPSLELFTLEGNHYEERLARGQAQFTPEFLEKVQGNSQEDVINVFNSLDRNGKDWKSLLDSLSCYRKKEHGPVAHATELDFCKFTIFNGVLKISSQTEVKATLRAWLVFALLKGKHKTAETFEGKKFFSFVNDKFCVVDLSECIHHTLIYLSEYGETLNEKANIEAFLLVKVFFEDFALQVLGDQLSPVKMMEISLEGKPLSKDLELESSETYESHLEKYHNHLQEMIDGLNQMLELLKNN